MIKTHVNPLTYDQYTKNFRTFVDRSHEYEFMLNFMTEELSFNHEKEITFLSIGAGTGIFDKKIFDSVSKRKIINYIAIEPNNKHIEQLKNTFNNSVYNITIIQEYFTETYKFQDDIKFDYILMSHSLYYMTDPIKIIIHASTFLKKGGKLIIFHQSNNHGVCPLVTKIYKYLLFTSPPMADHTYGAEDIFNCLSKCKLNGMSFSLHELDGYIDLDNYKNETYQLTGNTYNEILSFFLQTDITLLDDFIKNQLDVILIKELNNSNFRYGYNYVKFYHLYHPTIAIIINM